MQLCGSKNVHPLIWCRYEFKILILGKQFALYKYFDHRQKKHYTTFWDKKCFSSNRLFEPIYFVLFTFFQGLKKVKTVPKEIHLSR